MNYITPVFKKDQPDDSYKFRPLPLPTGPYPYHLSLSDVMPIGNPHHMVFHMAGDTGGEGNPEARKNIVENMAAQYTTAGFLYHLGDLVYHHGEAERYANQFFKPFENYPGPIFAIAGNHDSDVNPESMVPYQSLDAFKAVFCDSTRLHVSFSGNSKRQSMTQPNIYWTLETPLATFIGLHTNITKFGVVTAEQESWFREELTAAPKDKILIICLHHAPYSADTNHGSSLPMIQVLESAFEATNVQPDIVFSGHVHNYQRFHKTGVNGTEIPYIVSGAGGFDELHGIATLADKRFEPVPSAGISLKAYEDALHGFLKIDIKKINGTLTLTGNYFTISSGAALLSDQFTIKRSLPRD